MKLSNLSSGKFLIMVTALLWSAFLFSATPASAAVLAAGGDHNLFINDKGTLWAQGDNGYGLSNTLRALWARRRRWPRARITACLEVRWDRNRFWQKRFRFKYRVHAFGLSGVAAVAAGGYHSLALMSDGTVTAWGLNDYHQCEILRI